MTLLCLLSHQRSGSHFLKQTLNCYNDELDRLKSPGPRYLALPEIFTHGIGANSSYWNPWLFTPFHTERLLADPLKWGTSQGIAEAVELFLQHILQQSQDSIVLADVKINQLYIGEGWYHQPAARPRMLYSLLSKCKAVFLRRRNLIRAIFSGLQAKRTGVWHLNGPEAAAPEPAKITINIENFYANMVNMDRGITEAERWLAAYPDTVHSVYYEDLFDAQSYECNAAAFDQIANFAGMPAGIHWQSPMRKIGTYPLCEVVENFNELRKKLLPTKFAPMLADESHLRVVRCDAA